MPDAISVTENENGRNVTVPVGQTFDILLSENPTTGFNWQIHDQPQAVLRLAADDFELGTASAVGGGGMRRFRFEAFAPGTGMICLRYRRSWEDGDKFAKEFVLNVSVQ